MNEPAAERPLTPHLCAEERYRREPMYHAMVDMLTSVMAKLEMTPVEVREAAVFACIRFEHLNMNQMTRYIRGGILHPHDEKDMVNALDRVTPERD
jgi:hypothetical protein